MQSKEVVANAMIRVYGFVTSADNKEGLQLTKPNNLKNDFAPSRS